MYYTFSQNERRGTRGKGNWFLLKTNVTVLFLSARELILSLQYLLQEWARHGKSIWNTKLYSNLMQFLSVTLKNLITSKQLKKEINKWWLPTKICHSGLIRVVRWLAPVPVQVLSELKYTGGNLQCHRGQWSIQFTQTANGSLGADLIPLEIKLLLT